MGTGHPRHAWTVTPLRQPSVICRVASGWPVANHSRARGLNRTFRTTGASGPRSGSINFRPRRRNDDRQRAGMESGQPRALGWEGRRSSGPRGYDLTSLRAGRGRFNAIEEEELGPVDGRHILHLQCHFGADSLKLVQRGATVVGLDFSAAAIEAALSCKRAGPRRSCALCSGGPIRRADGDPGAGGI